MWSWRTVYRPRRTCLSVPGSSAKMIEKAKGLPADEVFLDLEDAVAPDAKAAGPRSGGRGAGRAGLGAVSCAGCGSTTGPRRGPTPTSSRWSPTAGAHLDVVVLPKVTDAVPRPGARPAADPTGDDPRAAGRPHRHRGADRERPGADQRRRDRGRGPRVQALVLGPADMMASLNMRTLVVGEQPEGYDVGDAYHHVLMRILVAARTHGINAIDGPFLKVRDVEAFRRVAGPVGGARLRRQVGAAPGPDRGGQRDLQPAPGRLRPRRVDPRGLRVAHVAGGWRPGRGDARRRDDRRGEPQDGAGDRGQGAGRRAWPARRSRSSRRASRSSTTDQ